MNKESLKNYIQEISGLLKDNAKKAKLDADNPKASDADYNTGYLMAYHEVITVMKNQAPFFNLEQEDIDLADIEAKIKNKPLHIRILVTEIRPYEECKYLIKSPFFAQESSCTFQELSLQKTRITLKINVISFFAPLMKKFFLKNVEKTRSKYLSAFAEAADRV